MRKILVIAGLAVLSTSAMATTARLTSLAQSNTGSLYIDDTRNVFTDASVVNTFKDYVVTEWGTNTALSTSATGRAEGGFFKSAGAINYGAYMNSDFHAQAGKRTAASMTGYASGTALNGAATVIERKNNLDVFVGGDMGVQWGARLSRASNKGTKNSATPAQLGAKQSSMGLGLGVTAGAIGAYANLGLGDKSTNAENSSTAGLEWKATGPLNLGASYVWGDYKFYGDYDSHGFKYKSSATASEQKTSEKIITVGAAKTHKVSGNSKVWMAAEFVKTNSADTVNASATVQQENKLAKTSVPLTIAFEVDAASWLTWRGSVKQDVLVSNSKYTDGGTTSAYESKSTPNSTAVAGGATLNFGKLMVDGSLGVASGILNTSSLLTNVGVHYWF